MGIEIDPTYTKAKAVCLAMLRRGVLAKETHDTVLRLAPPLVIEEQDLMRAVAIFGEALGEVAPRRQG